MIANCGNDQAGATKLTAEGEEVVMTP